jgi:hypothetical protein
MSGLAAGTAETTRMTQSGIRAGFVILGNYIGDEDIQRSPQSGAAAP